VPVDCDAASLALSIQELGRSLTVTSSIESLNAYIDTSRLGTQNANALSQMGVNLIHSPSAKEAADKAIIVDLLLWLLIFERNLNRFSVPKGQRPEPCIVLISQDHDFEPLLNKLRNQRNIHVVIVTKFATVRTHFLNSCSEAFDWDEIVANAVEMTGSIPKPIAQEQSLPMKTESKDSLTQASTNSVAPSCAAALRSTSSSSSDAGDVGRKLKKRYSSIRRVQSNLEDAIADFVLKVLKSKQKITTDVLIHIMKNPATGGSAEMYNLAVQDYGKHFEEIIAKHPDRFELSQNKRSQKTWIKLLPGPHEPVCQETCLNETTSTPVSSDNNLDFDQPRLRRQPSNWGVIIEASSNEEVEAFET